MNVYHIAEQILCGESLFGDKLLNFKLSDIDYSASSQRSLQSLCDLPQLPAREKKIQISSEQAKFPRRASFHLDEKRAMAMHFFANHELLAIEMMAAAILAYPIQEEETRILFHKGLLKTIQDEQKHLKMYLNRMKEWGLELGDLKLNDFFWNYMPALKTPSMFYATMALTFESANLDFAQYYSECFREVDDQNQQI